MDPAGEFSTVLSGEDDRDAFGVEDSDPPAEALEFEDFFELLDLAEEGFDELDLADDLLELVFESLSLSPSPGTLRESFTLSDALDFAEELLEEALEAASTEAAGEGDLEMLLESFPDDFDFPEAADCADLADEALKDFWESLSFFALSALESSLSDLAEDTRELVLDLLSSSSALRELLETVLVEAPAKDFADAALDDPAESPFDDVGD